MFLKVLCATLFTLLPLAAPAQTVSDVTFQRGSYGTTIKGTIIGDEYLDYRLGAKAGQKLTAAINVEATNGNGTVYFNIMPPNAEWEAIYVGQNDIDNGETVVLPQDGTYVIRVYLMGNDAATGRKVEFSIDVSIE